LLGGGTKPAEQVQPGDLISMTATPPTDHDHAWEVIFSFRVDAGSFTSYVIYLAPPLPTEQMEEQDLINGQITQYQQAVGNTLAAGKAGVQFGLEGYVQLAQAYASGPFFELGAQQLLSAGFKAADVLQRVNLARADAARLQKAVDLSATLIARLSTIKATASPAEAAQIEA
jgi:hypothetical protein